MPELIYENRYYSLGKPYYDMFSRDNIFILFYDDLVSRPVELCKNLFRFLGVDENFIPSVIDKKVNTAIIPRFPLATLLTKGAAIILRSLHLYGFLTHAKRSDRIKNLFFKGYDYKKENLITEKARAILDPVFLPEIDKLENLVGAELSGWKK
ncbi:MAG: hypothetical protein HY752_00275 [Nitrospirae bacterium]|nr:hypothetical protein [Nitrospirota bacterium]